MAPRTPGRRLEALVRANWEGARGISGFCDRVGVTREALYKWFRGESSPTMDHLTAMAETLRMPRWEIVAAMDGDLDRQRQVIADEVEAAIGPLRQLLRDAGLVPGERLPDGAPRGERQ